MTEQLIPEPWRSLACEWVPRLIAVWSAEGLKTDFGTLRLLSVPPVFCLNGESVVTLGPVVFSTTNTDVVAYLSGKAIAVGEHKISFPKPIPDIAGIPDGLKITWPEPGVVHGLLARAVGVKIVEVRLYARSAVVILDNYPDAVLRW